MVQQIERNIPPYCGWCTSKNSRNCMRRAAAYGTGGFCPILSLSRKISFDGFVNYEGRRFGVPYSYLGATARVERSGDLLRIYSADLKVLLATHTVTWSRTDSFCEGQYESLAQPEEFPTAPVQTQIFQLPKPSRDLSFAKFDFDKEDQV